MKKLLTTVVLLVFDSNAAFLLSSRRGHLGGRYFSFELASSKPQVPRTSKQRRPDARRQRYIPTKSQQKDDARRIRELSNRRAYHKLLVYANSTKSQAAIVALTRSPKKFSKQVLELVLNSDSIQLSPKTCVSLFSIADSSSAAITLMNHLQTLKYNLPPKVWNAAIYYTNDWQTALYFLQEMKRHGTVPNTRTYANLLHKCAGQVPIVMALIEELMKTGGDFIINSAQIWGTALNACAKCESPSVDEAFQILEYMQQRDVPINTIHCTAFLATLAKARQDQTSLQVLYHFRNGTDAILAWNDKKITFPPVPLDLVMITIVLSSCAKADNYKAAKQLLKELKDGHFGASIEPDVICYNTVLSCSDSADEAIALVKEMRMSRRHRYGAVPPTSKTYTNAITACRKNVDKARLLLDMADDDGIPPNVYMYSAAIWCCDGDGDVALELLNEMKSVGCTPNVISWNGVLAALASEGRAEEALSLYEEMKDNDLHPTRVTFQRLASAIRMCQEDIAKSEMLQRVVTLMEPNELRANIGGAILEALIRQYGAGGKYAEASRVFEQIQGPANAKCLRAMVYACSAASPPRWEDALRLLHTSDIVEGTHGPAKVDARALSYAMLACAKADQWPEALNIAELYGRAYLTSRVTDPKDLSTNGAVTLPAFNALIAACGRCRQPGTALRVLNDMESVYGVSPDERTYCKAVIACNQAEHDKRRRQRQGLVVRDEDGALQWWECALSLLRRMEEGSLKPNPQIYSSVISACEAAGQWQRALGVLHSMIKTNKREADDYSRLNLYCFNAAISACEKGGAWVESLELYYRMKDKGGRVTPNFVTLSSLLVALDRAGQKELAQSTYEEGVRDRIVSQWKTTTGTAGGRIRAMDLHRFSGAMACAAVRSVMESLLTRTPAHDATMDLVIIVGKGKGSERKPVLFSRVLYLLKTEYQIAGEVDDTNAGRLVISSETLQLFIENKSWR